MPHPLRLPDSKSFSTGIGKLQTPHRTSAGIEPCRGIARRIAYSSGHPRRELAPSHCAQKRSPHGCEACLESRPFEVELTAIRAAIEFAGETGCALHVVHVSSPEGIALIDAARDQRVDVTAETCPHYLLLNDKDVAKIGAAAKCAPPIRDEKRRVAVWRELRAGRIQTIGSDHSPSPPEMKTAKSFFEIWGGIAGCQHGFQLVMSECEKTAEKDLPVLAGAMARNVARRFRIDGRKGSVAVGQDADFSLVDIGPARTIRAEELWTRHRLSPYIGRRCHVRVTHTYVRGNAVYAAGRLTNLPPPGQFLTPSR